MLADVQKRFALFAGAERVEKVFYAEFLPHAHVQSLFSLVPSEISTKSI